MPRSIVIAIAVLASLTGVGCYHFAPAQLHEEPPSAENCRARQPDDGFCKKLERTDDEWSDSWIPRDIISEEHERQKQAIGECFVEHGDTLSRLQWRDLHRAEVALRTDEQGRVSSVRAVALGEGNEAPPTDDFERCLSRVFEKVNYAHRAKSETRFYQMLEFLPQHRIVRLYRPRYFAEIHQHFNGIHRYAIQRTIRENRRKIAYCYERELQKDEDLAGEVKVRWEIDHSGKVIAAEISHSTLDSPEVESCMIDMILKFEFPPHGGKLVVVNYPFSFSYRR